MPPLSLKATVTRRPAEPVDADERAAQHHEAVENAAMTATGPAVSEQTDQALPKPKVDPHELQLGFLKSNLNRIVTVFTINGVRLVGKLKQFDQFTLLLRGPDGACSLVFKHAISTIAPAPANDHHE